MAKDEPQKSPLISLIIPVHNEADSLEWHHAKISDVISRSLFEYEVIYINDGSTDKSLEIIKIIAASDTRVRYIAFPRNFGKEAATSAGLLKARGDAAIILDADGQHPIELVHQFLEAWQAGSKVVTGVRESNKGASVVKSIGSRLFYTFLHFIGGNDSAKQGITDFRLVDRQVVDEFKRLTEHNRVTRNLIDWFGFPTTYIPFHAHERHAGTASYSFRKLFKLAVDGIIKHSTRPLKIIGLIGSFVSLVSFVALVVVLSEKYLAADIWHWSISGTAILALFLAFMVGIVLFCQGLIALYLENVYLETQNRPLYVISEEG